MHRMLGTYLVLLAFSPVLATAPTQGDDSKQLASQIPDLIDRAEPWAAYEGKRGGDLWALSAEDGKVLAKYDLDAPPVLDGLAASHGRLLVSTIDGKILCYRGDDP